MMKGNKGEWSEIYTLLKLLGDKKLHLGDVNVKKLEGAFYPILKILRKESDGTYEFAIKNDLVFVSNQAKILLRIPVIEFKNKALLVLTKIKQNKKTTFVVPDIEPFLQKIHCKGLKATSDKKTDITIIIHDYRTSQQPTLGFSIKSQLGSPSSLVNAGQTTNFIYRITHLSLNLAEITEINNINSRKKIQHRIQAIENRGGILKYEKMNNRIFHNNLTLVDSCLPKIFSRIIYYFFTSSNSKMKDLVEIVTNENPIEYDTSNNHKFYDYKIKRYLTDAALGMQPSTPWSGEYEAKGGYLIVNKEGEILCYHIYDKTHFENYLMNNTKLETASSSRHKYGIIYKENDALFIKLNLQIRFIK